MSQSQTLEMNILQGERWWGGLVQDGISMPYGSGVFERDLGASLRSNQGNPLLLSSKGRYVWSEEPFAFSIANEKLIVKGTSLQHEEGYDDLRHVLKHVSRTYFPPSETIPDPLFFTAPQYNTWIEMMYEPTQDKVVSYAKSILEHGMPPGILMIDAGWQEYYGYWDFHPGRFPDPKAMVDTLHHMGFKVMLWVCNFITADTVIFRKLRNKGYLLRDANGLPAIREWWDGYSAVLDSTHEDAVTWFQEQLDHLIAQYDIDGFKLDAGDPETFRSTDLCSMPSHPNGHCEAWAKVGLRYPLNEYRACWKMAGQRIAQRLCDKNHSWRADDGLGSLIPNGLALGLLGYAYICPDMIGGGNYASFLDPSFELDQELIVRSAQCAALFPMMQFSIAPWRVLDQQHLEYCVESAKLHQRFGVEIVKLAIHASMTGEPILRHMCYVYAEHGYEQISDQFLLGDDILVAPVLIKGAVQRNVIFPPGSWSGDDGSRVEGPCELVIEAPLSRLPWYRKENAG